MLKELKPLILHIIISIVLVGCGPSEETPIAKWIYVTAATDGEVGAGTLENPYRRIQDAVDMAPTGATIYLLPGTHYATPTPAIDTTCGNCNDAEFRAIIPITVGVAIRGKSLRLLGESARNSILNTGSGYGVFFEHAGTSTVEHLTITGGIRDADPRATDAGIVVRYTHLKINQVRVIENDDLYKGTPDPVVGVMGITGREGSKLDIRNSQILDNSWDGITLYRSDPDVPDSKPYALIINNEVGCTSECVTKRGRGVGIGLTWDSSAEIRHTRVHHYWKGIGTFGHSRGEMRNTIVENHHGWGVILSGNSHMLVANNVIARNGTTGLAAWNEGVTGAFINNVIIGNGWNDEWVGKRTGIWMNSTQNFPVRHNVVWSNTPEQMCTGGLPGETPCIAIPLDEAKGNAELEPSFADWRNYIPKPNSPLINTGAEEILDADGSPSDIGIYGGPFGEWPAP